MILTFTVFLLYIYELQAACQVIFQEGPVCSDIDLESDGLSALSANISRLTLTGSHGNLSENTLSRFGNLENLVIKNSDINHIAGGSICISERLQTIHFIETKLPAISEGTFKNCSGTKSLHFLFMPAVEIEGSGFSGLSNLENFLFDHGNWTHLTGEQLAGLGNLRQLTITNSGVEEVDPNFFHSVPNLKRLSLVGNNIDAFEPGTFGNLTKLEDLQLFGNNMTVITGREFRGLNSLYVLDVIHNPVASIDVDTLLDNLPSLQHIYLTRSNIESSQRRIIARKLKDAGLSKLDY